MAPETLRALEGSEAWMTAALECPTWRWDADQHEAATATRDEVRAIIAAAPKASAVLDALENLVIAIQMGWDLDGVLGAANSALEGAGRD